MQITPFTLIEQHPVFDDYLSDFEKVQSFYALNFRNAGREALEQRSRFEVPREKMSDILLSQNRQWEAPETTLEQIGLLRNSNTLAVITGQQAGILGGPLYTFYKTITVLQLCRRLKKEYPQHDFVALFWMEVNDNDFEEIRSIHYITRDNRLKRLTARENEDDLLKPIFARKVDGGIREWRQFFGEDFFDTEFKEEAINLFLEGYTEHQTYADAFARLLLGVFGRYGLIVLNPAAPSICSLTGPLFQKVLTSTEAIQQTMSERTTALEQAGYPPQIQFRPDQTLLFYNDSELQRVRIDVGEKGQFLLKYPSGYRHINLDELLKSCEEKPHYLSPNVALRPLMQDFLLPTAAYVGGPGEIAYFAQVEALYRLLDMPLPVIYPRHRLTIIENKIQKILQKYRLDMREIVQKPEHFVEQFIQQSANQKLFARLESTEQKITGALEDLHTLLSEADPTLVNSLDKTRQHIEGSFQKLSSKITRSLEQQNQTLVQQLERMLLYLLPENTYQERVLNMIYFCVKYGTGFIDELYEALPEDTTPHYLVTLD